MIDAIRKVGFNLSHNLLGSPSPTLFTHSFPLPLLKPHAQMANANVGSLLVFDPSKISISRESGDIKLKSAAKEAVVGIFTERDYLTKIVVKGRNSSNTKVSAVMTPGESLITVTPSHSVLDVMELMVAKNFRHMPVISEGTMAGMVSVRDVVHVMLKEHREEVGRLQEYIQGTF